MRTELDVNIIELLVAAVVAAGRAGRIPLTVVIDDEKEVVQALFQDEIVAEVPF